MSKLEILFQRTLCHEHRWDARIPALVRGLHIALLSCVAPVCPRLHFCLALNRDNDIEPNQTLSPCHYTWLHLTYNSSSVEVFIFTSCYLKLLRSIKFLSSDLWTQYTEFSPRKEGTSSILNHPGRFFFCPFDTPSFSVPTVFEMHLSKCIIVLSFYYI